MPFVLKRYLTIFKRSFFQRQSIPVSQRRHPLFCIAFLVIYPLIEGIHFTFLLLDRLIPSWHRKRHPVPPIFIIGAPRSGTTITHRVLMRDTRRFFVFLTWEIAFPSILEKGFFAGLGWIDQKIGHPWKKLVIRMERKNQSEFAKAHQTGFFLPEEDDKLMAHILASPEFGILFPYADFQRWIRMDTDVPQAEQDAAMDFYKQCVMRQAFLKGQERRLLSKNPHFTGKIDALLRTFPDCKFIYMVRNPLDVIPSTISLARTIAKLTVSKETHSDLDIEIYHMVRFYYLHALDRLSKLPEDRVIVVNYEDLMRDPRDTFGRIYDQFGWTLSSEFASILDKEVGTMRQHRSRHHYSLDDSCITADRIRDELAVVFERYGFDKRQEQT